MSSTSTCVASFFRPSWVATVLALVAAPAFGQNGTWNTTTNGTWTTASNWLDNTIADGVDNTAFFTFNITNALDVTLGADRTIGGITFTDSTTSSHDMTISGGDILTLDVTTGFPTIDVTQSGRTLTIGSVIAGDKGLRKRGSGSLILTASNTYTSATTVAGGTLTLSGSNGAIGSSSLVSLMTGGAFTISNASGANNTNRLNNFVDMTVTGGGTFNFLNDGSNTAFSETLDILTLASGAFTLGTSQAGASGTSALTFSSISRSAGGGTVLFSGTGFGNSTRNQVLVTTALSSQNVGGGTAILPWALIQDGATYNLAIGGAANGAITQLTSYDTASGSDPTWGATVNARPGGDVTLTNSDKSLNSLVLDNGRVVGRASQNQVRTLTIGSATQAGLIVQTGGSSSIIGDNGARRAITLAFGTREGIFNTIGQLTIQRNQANQYDLLLSGSGGITKTGNGTLTLGATDIAFVQNFTGALNLNQGTYEIFADATTGNATFGNATNTINFTGGNLLIHHTANQSFNNPLTVNANATLTSDRHTGSTGAGVAYTFGTLALNNDPNLTIATGASVTSGTQQVTVGAVTLNSNATFTLTNGATATTQLSVGAVTNGVNTVTVAGNGNLIQTGVWGSGAGGLTLATGYTGLVTFDQANTYTGATTINGGTLRAGAAASGQAFGNLSAVTTANVAGAVLDLNNFSQTIGSLAGGGTTGGNVTLGSATLTTGGNNASTTYAGIISGTSGSLIKTGTGTQIFTGASTYTAGTAVNAGTLLANNITGSATGSGAVTVNSGATFGGTGSIAGALTVNADGTLSPGDSSIQSLATGANTWNGSMSFDFEFDTDGSTGSAGTNWDLLAATGGLDLTGATALDQVVFNLFTMSDATTPGVLASWDPNVDHTWAGFVTTTTGFTAFDSAKFNIVTTGFQNTINGTFSVEQSGNNLNLVYVAVPEPPMIALAAAAGVAGLVIRRRRKA